MEIADVFVINKADRPGVEETRRDLETMLEMTDLGAEDWRPPIVACVAAKGEGIIDVWDAVLAHRAHLESTGGLEERRSARTLEELRTIVARSLERRAYELTSTGEFADLHAAVVARELDPYAAADQIIEPLADH
jgi:LAO/AO transport system kinase